jgi:hypothetical protein
MSESFSLGNEDEYTNGRSLSELSISWTQTADLILGVSDSSVDNPEDGGLGEFGEFPFSIGIQAPSSRTGSLSAGRSYSQSSVQTDVPNIIPIRPHAENAFKETVRALKRSLETSESNGRTPSQEMQDAVSNYDDYVTRELSSNYGDIEVDSAVDKAVVPPPEDLIPGLDQSSGFADTGEQVAVSIGGNTSNEDLLKDIYIEMRTGEDGETRMFLIPTSFQARLLVIQWYESIRLLEDNYLSAVPGQNPEQNPLPHCRTLSDRPFPQPTEFTVRRIAAGAGRLFGNLQAGQSSAVIDIPMLTRLCRPGR